ncbi:MAG: protein kinase [Kofleriaceae bacterium]
MGPVQGDAPTAAAPVVEPSQTGSGSTGVAPLEGRVDLLTVIDRAHYEVLAEFGRGGLGRVLRARDRRTGRIVAIKEVLRPTPGLVARFAREAIVTANLQHPAIVPVYEVGRWLDTGDPFYAMKLVAGASLMDSARKARTLEQRLALLPHIISVAEALAYAHGERVIHRDLKPANVLIGDFGETVVIDWGLAKRLDDLDAEPTETAGGEGKTMLGSVLGTPGYMPPEQARGDAADERSDVYAIGAMLYEVLSGVRPFADSDGGTEVLKRTMAEPPKPLARIAPDIPAELVAIVERAMAADPEQRYRTAKPLAEDLVRYTTGQLVAAQRYTAWMLIRRWIAKHRAVVAVAGAAIVVLAIVAVIGLSRIRTERDRAVAARGLADDRAAALAEEQGRQLTMTGDAPRGLPFLADAITRGRSSVPLRFVTQRALDRIAGVEAVLSGSTTPVNYVEYSPDGKLVAAASNEIRIWDPHAHRLVKTLATGVMTAWSHDGKFLASIEVPGVAIGEPQTPAFPNQAIDDHEELVIRDATTFAILQHWPVPEKDAPLTLAISPDSRLVALGGDHGHLSWFHVDNSAPPVVLAPYTSAIDALVFSHDGAMLAAAANEGRADVWTIATATSRVKVTHKEGVRDITFAPDDTRFVTGSVDGTATEWDLAGKQLHTFAHDNAVESTRYDANGTHLLIASEDKAVTLWDLATAKKIWTHGTGSGVIEARYSPNGAQVSARTEHGEIFIWNADGSNEIVLSGHISSVGQLDWSPDGTQLVSGGLDGDVRLWRPRLHDVTELATTSIAWRGTWSPDGSKIAVSSKDGSLPVYDGHTGAIVVKLAGHAQEVTWIAFSPSGTELASASLDGTVKLWNLATGDSAVLNANAGRVRWVSYAHDGKTIATTHDDGSLRLWDATTHAAGPVVTIGEAHARRAIWSPDDTKLLVPLDGKGGGGGALVGRDGKVIAALPLTGTMALTGAWSADGSEVALSSDADQLAHYTSAGVPIGTMIGHTIGPLLALEYAPHAPTTLVSAGGDGVARTWRDGKPIQIIGDASFRISGLAYRPDGELLATGALDIDVFDPQTGVLVGKLPGKTDQFNTSATELHWSPDGTRLLINSFTLPPRIWTVPEWKGTPDELAARLRCALREKLEGSRLVTSPPDAASCLPLGP